MVSRTAWEEFTTLRECAADGLASGIVISVDLGKRPKQVSIGPASRRALHVKMTLL